MPKISEVSRDAVFAACRHVRDSGHRVTFARVYERLGHKGGSKVVQYHIADWFSLEDQEFLPGLPPAFVASLRQMGTIVFDEAMKEADTRLANRKEQLELAAKDAQVAATQAILKAQEEVNAMAMAKADTEQRLVLITQEKAVLEERVAALTQSLKDRDQTLETTGAALTAKTTEVAALNEKLESSTAKLQEELRLERASGQDAINRERERSAGERQHLMAQTDQIRQDKERELSEARTTLLATERRLEESREKETALAKTEGELRTALSLSNRDREALEAKNLSLVQQVQQLSTELATDRGRLGALEERLASVEPKQVKRRERSGEKPSK